VCSCQKALTDGLLELFSGSVFSGSVISLVKVKKDNVKEVWNIQEENSFKEEIDLGSG